MTAENPDEPRLGDRFLVALGYAALKHRFQLRKGTDIPYLGHLLGVASIVIEDGGTEDEAIAALLHDAVEDQGGKETRAEIARLFGERVAEIVDGCTDADTTPKPPWRERKEAYLAHLAEADESVLRVSLADKLYNARETLFDSQSDGPAVWRRFNATRDELLWYYGALLDVFRRRRGDDPLVREMTRVLDELMRAGTSPSGRTLDTHTPTRG